MTRLLIGTLVFLAFAIIALSDYSVRERNRAHLQTTQSIDTLTLETCRTDSECEQALRRQAFRDWEARSKGGK